MEVKAKPSNDMPIMKITKKPEKWKIIKKQLIKSSVVEKKGPRKLDTIGAVWLAETRDCPKTLCNGTQKTR